jgi:hypothetical protein
MARLSLNVDQETYESAGRSFEPVPVGRYKVGIFAITPDEVKTGENKGKLRLKFQFRIAEGEVAADGSRQQNRRLFADVNAFDGVDKKTNAPTPPYDLVAIGKALGYDSEALKDIDTDDWLGEELYLDVTWAKKQEQVNGVWVDKNPVEFKEKTRGYRSVESVETSAAATAAVTGKVNTGAKAGVAATASKAPAKKQLIKL